VSIAIGTTFRSTLQAFPFHAARFHVYTAVKVQVIVFWAVASQCGGWTPKFRWTVLERGSTVLRNVGVLPHHYTVSSLEDSKQVGPKH